VVAVFVVAKMESFVVAKLLDKIHTHTAQVAIIGLGYVGLPLAVAFAEAGFPVVGIDVDPAKVDAINAGHSYISDIRTPLSSSLKESSQFDPTWDQVL